MKKVEKSKIPLFAVWVYETVMLFVRFFTYRKKLSTKHNFKEPFFIIGCGRSGNTLLRSMLVAGGEVSIPPESYVWPRIIRRFWPLSFLPWNTLSSFVVSEFEAYKEFNTWETNLYRAHSKARSLPKKKQTLSHIIDIVYRTYIEEKGENADRWGDKTPINTIFIDKIIKIFPKAQFIHIVRDPRDVVCSYTKAGLYNNYWDALAFWKESNNKAIKLKQRLPENQYFQVKYEELVKSPETELKKICGFLNIKYTDKLLDFWKNKDNLGDVAMRKHHENLKNPINTNSIGKWKTVLSREDVERIESVASEVNEDYGYFKP
ncbi:MAG: sulfotransferase [Allomuricauda sp.]